MPFTIRGVTEAGDGITATVTSLSPAIPSGTVSGDFLLLGVSWNSLSITLTDPAGWTLLDKTLQTNDNIAVYYKTATGSDTAPTLNFSATCMADAKIIAIGGWDGNAPVHANQLGGASSTTTTFPAITPNTASDMLIYVTGLRTATTGATVTAVAPSGGTGGTVTIQADGCTNGSCNANMECSVMTQQLTAATAVPQETATVSTSVTSNIEAVIISPASSPSITTASLPAAMTGQAYSETLSASGGTSPYTWSISSGSLPSWASLGSSTGIISGTPPAGTLEYSPSFTVEVTDSLSATGTQAYVLQVGQLLQSAWPGFPAPALFVPGELIIQSSGTQHNTTLATEIGILAVLVNQVRVVEETSVAVTASQSRSVKKNVSSVIALPAMVSRKISRALTAAFVTVTMLLRTPTRTLTSSVAVTAAITAARARATVLIANLAVTASTQRKIGRVLAAVTALTTSLPRNITHLFTAPVTVTASVARQVNRTFQAAVAIFPSVTTTKVKQITLAAVTALTGTLTKTIGKPVQTQIAVTPVVTRTVNRTVTATIAVVANAVAIKAKFMTFITSIAVTPNVTRATGKLLNTKVAVEGSLVNQVMFHVKAVTAVTVTAARKIPRTVTAVVALTATQTQIKVQTVILSALVAVNSVVTRKVMPILQSSVILIPGNIRAITRTIQGTLGIAGQTARGIGRVFTAPVVVLGKINASKAYIIAVTTIVSVSSTVKRKAQVTQATVVNVTGNVTRFIGKNIAAPVSALISFIAGRPHVIVLTTAVSVSATVVAKLSQAAFVITFKYGVIATRWITGQITGRWKTGP